MLELLNHRTWLSLTVLAVKNFLKNVETLITFEREVLSNFWPPSSYQAWSGRILIKKIMILMMIKAMSKVQAKIRMILQNKVKKKKINHQKSQKKLKRRIDIQRNKLAGQKIFAKGQNSLQSQKNKMTKSNSKNRHTINLQKLQKKHI